MKRVVLLAAGCCLAAWASAQSAADNANVERMDRAKRDAANPLRMIIEASQVKRGKGNEPAPAAPAPAAPASASVAAARPAPRPSTAATAQPSSGITERVQPLPTTAAVPAPAPSPVANAAGASPAAATPSPAPQPAAMPATVAVTGSLPTPNNGAANGGAAAVPLSATPAAVASPAPVPKPAADPQLATASPRSTPTPAARAAEAPLKLTKYIEPELPQRLRSRLKANSEVTVTFRVNPDGSVSDPDVRNSSNHALDPIVIDAVKQWRYEPISETRIHAVQLVFNLDN